MAIYNKNGTNGSDMIYVTEPDVDVIGGYGNDVFIVQGKASGNQIGNWSDEYGDDNLTVKAGDIISFQNQYGSNTITLSYGLNHYIGTGDKKDVLSINGTADSVTANLGAGANVITVDKGTNHKISCGNGSDRLTVNYAENSEFKLGSGENSIKIAGGFGNTAIAGDHKDTVTVIGGYSNSIDVGDGDDVITVNGGSATISGEYGDDTFYVNAEAGSCLFYSGYGNDRFVVKSNSKQTIVLSNGIKYASDDVKTVLIKAGNEHDVKANNNVRTQLYIENANKVTADLSGSVDKGVITSGSENSIDLERGDDIGSIRGGSDNLISGGYGSDTLSIEGKAGANNQLYGGDNDDNLYVNAGASGLQMLSGGRNDNRDSFNVSSEKAIVYIDAIDDKAAINLCKGNAVDDTGNGHKVESSASENYLYIGYGKENTVANNVRAIFNGRLNNCLIYGSNNDVRNTWTGWTDKNYRTQDNIYIRSGENNYVDSGRGDDYIFIQGGNNHTVCGGSEYNKDNFYVSFALASNTCLTFNQSGSGDKKDILHLQNDKKGNFSYSYNSSADILSIHKNNGGLITVTNWQDNRFKGIEFSDGFYSNWDSVPVYSGSTFET